jgi:phosphatidylinositol-3-phosphatase
MRFLRRLAPLLAGSVLVAACQPTLSGGNATPSPTPAAKQVFVIVLENTSYRFALRQPYIAGLARRYGLATNYDAITNPSVPNYLAMTSGSTWGIRDDGFHQLPATGLGNELTRAGVSWKAYMEGFTGDCFNSPYPYAVKHNPFAYYGGACPPNVVPMTELASDLNGHTPQLAWITPDMCNDGHDCGIARADRWLSHVVPQIIKSKAWQQGGVLFITWDEGSGEDAQVALLVVARNVRGQITMPLNHYSLLATIADRLGVARLGQSRQATSLKRQLEAGIEPSPSGG